MIIKGRIKQINPAVSGMSRTGNPYCKQGFIVEAVEGGNNYPMNIYIEAFGEEKLSALGAKTLGQELEIQVTINSREFNGKYYTDVSLVRFLGGQPAAAPAAMPAAAPSPQPYAPAPPLTSQTGDDLPF